MEIFTAIGMLVSFAVGITGVSFGVIYIVGFVKDLIEFRSYVKRKLNYQLNAYNKLNMKLEMCEAAIKKLENRVTMLRGKDG